MNARLSPIHFLFSLFLLFSMPVKAVFLEADALESDGVNTTVDLWFFSFTGVGPNTNFIQANDITPILGSDLDMVIYLDDGTFSNVFASDLTVGAEPKIANYPVGDYVAVIGNNGLTVGQFGPYYVDNSFGVNTLQYEFNGPEPNNDTLININCVLSGNLDGTYTTRVLNQNTCRLPPSSVSEPGIIVVFVLGLAGLMFARRRVRS